MDSNIGGKVPRKQLIARGSPPKAAVRPPAQPLPGEKPPSHIVFARIIDEDTGKPIPRACYEVVDDQGKVVAAGETDHTGTVHHDVHKAGRYHVRLAEEPKGPPPKKDLGEKLPNHVVFARFVDEETGKPLPGAGYEIVDEQSKVIARGKADESGVVRREVDAVGTYHVRLVEG